MGRVESTCTAPMGFVHPSASQFSPISISFEVVATPSCTNASCVASSQVPNLHDFASTIPTKISGIHQDSTGVAMFCHVLPVVGSKDQRNLHDLPVFAACLGIFETSSNTFAPCGLGL